MEIAEAKRDDIRAIASFLHACWQTEYRQIITADFLDTMSVDERHRRLLIRFDEGISDFLMMWDGAKMIGASVFGKSVTDGYPEDGEISAIYLHHDYIGQGYGHTLITEIEQRLSDSGYVDFVLDVLTDNIRAVDFYRRHDYEQVDIRSIQLGERDYSLTVFRKHNSRFSRVGGEV